MHLSMKNRRKQIKVALMGTCNESTWRERLKLILKIEFYDPVVPNWTKECQEEEIRQRQICDYCLYVITPKMTGSFAIAEVVQDSNKRPEKTIFCFLKEDDGVCFSGGQIRSLDAVANMVKTNGANIFETLEQIADFLNNQNSSSMVICNKADECPARCNHKNMHNKDENCGHVCKDTGALCKPVVCHSNGRLLDDKTNVAREI